MRVLFVCLGNICRSPAAEAIFSEKIKHSTLVFTSVESAGILSNHQGEPLDRRMANALKLRGYRSLSKSAPVTKEDFEIFDHILAMDNNNLRDLQDIAPEKSSVKIHLMCDFCESRGEKEVPDPYYGGEKGFQLVIDILEDATRGFITHLEQQ